MYDLWFCQDYPIEKIVSSIKVDRSGREKIQARLAENIRENGLINPLIIMSHRPPKWKDHYCMQGLNRLNAVKLLGWSTVPCIITGPCNHEPRVRVKPEDVQQYFFDGKTEFKKDSWNRLHLIDVTLPDNYDYPTAGVGNEYRPGVFKHDDYKSVPVRNG